MTDNLHIVTLHTCTLIDIPAYIHVWWAKYLSTCCKFPVVVVCHNCEMVGICWSYGEWHGGPFLRKQCGNVGILWHCGRICTLLFSQRMWLLLDIMALHKWISVDWLFFYSIRQHFQHCNILFYELTAVLDNMMTLYCSGVTTLLVLMLSSITIK